MSAQVRSYRNVIFNMRNPELNDKAVRQGLAYGIPELPWERAGSPISSTSWAYAKNVGNIRTPHRKQKNY